MFKRCKRGMRNAGCGTGKNAKPGILGKRLGCRASRLAGRNVDGETTDYGYGHGWLDGEVEIKCLTVIHLIRGWAVTTYDFHDALLERWTGGIYRPAIRAKLRLNRRHRQQRACPAVRLWVTRVTG